MHTFLKKKLAMAGIAGVLASYIVINTAPIPFAHATACTDPVFFRHVIATGLSNPADAFPADVDEDGDIDVVVPVRNGDAIIRYDNDGAENFSASNIYSGSSQTPWTVDVGDLDNDGDMDVVSGDDSSGIYARFNNGSETFGSQLLQNGAGYSVKIVDLDEDGNNDVVAARQAGGVTSVTWYRRTTGTTFTTNVIGTGGTFMEGMDVEDIDDDNDLDVIGAAWGGVRQLKKYVNNGSETFTQSVMFTGTGNLFMSPMADLDGDNDLDFAVTDYASDGEVSLFRNDGTGTFTRVTITDPTDFPESVDVVDLDDDGDVDIVVQQSTKLVMYRNNGNGTSFPAVQISTQASDSNYLRHADVNEDGYMDIVLAYGSSSVAWFEQTCDTTPPTISSLSPADNATGVSASANLVITFNEAIAKTGTGTVTIKLSSDDSTVETIAVTSSKVTGSGTNIITINPATTLGSEGSYYINISRNAFPNAAQLDFAGITNATTWNFTTADTYPPVLDFNDSTPADGSTDVDVNTDIVLSFVEAVRTGTGHINIRKYDDDSIVESVASNAGVVTGSGTDTITYNPSVTLSNLTHYYVTVDANAFTDLSGNKFPAYTDHDEWDFYTIAAASSSSSSRAQGGGGRRGAGTNRSAGTTTNTTDTTPSLSEFPSCPNVSVPAPGRSQGGKLMTSVNGTDTVFRDVDVQAWFASYIDDLIGKGILSGYKNANGTPSGMYGPANSVTVAEVLKMALEAFEEPATSPKKPEHPDAAGHWSASYMARAEELGIDKLLGANLDAPATRGLAVAIFARTAGLPSPKVSALPYSDVQLDEDHVSAIAAATNACWVRGDTNAQGNPTRTFRPGDTLNRAEAAKILSVILRIK